MDPDPVCPESLDPDPVNIRPYPQPWLLTYTRYAQIYLTLKPYLGQAKVSGHSVYKYQSRTMLL